MKKEQPLILGALLSGLSVGLRRLPTLKPSSLPRMATFAKWAMACETAFWPEGAFIAAYQGNIATAVDDVIDSDKAVSTIRVFMAGRNRWEGTATNLLEALAAFVKQPLRDAQAELEAAIFDSTAQSRAEAKLREAREKVRETLGKGWPCNPRALSGRLKKAGPALRPIGVAIEWPTRHGDARIITITSSSRTCAHLRPHCPMRPKSTRSRRPQQIKTKTCGKTRAASRDANGKQGGRRKDATSRPLRPTISA